MYMDLQYCYFSYTSEVLQSHHIPTIIFVDFSAPGVFRGSRSIPLPRTDSDDDLDDEFQRLPGKQYASKLASPKRRSHREYDEDDMMKDIEAEYDLPTSKQGRKLYPGFSEDDRSSTVSADVVAEAKYRLKSLEREAQVRTVK